MKILAAIIIGYFLGSIPFALVIGKLFFQKDIRNYGSKNLGGGNAGRVLGKKAGLAVMTLDLLKVTLAIFLTALFANDEIILILAGLSAAGTEKAEGRKEELLLRLAKNEIVAEKLAK